MRQPALLPLCISLALAASLAADAARAQAANVIEEADDAFGTRIGQETLGLYSETLVRGFNLQDSGNFLLDGAYFVRAGGLTDAVLGSTAIRVGPNALAFDSPAPSGVVDYQLLGDSAARFQWQVGLADLAESQLRPYARLFGTTRGADGRWSVAGGFVGFPQETYPDGSSGAFYTAGLVPRWRPTEDIEITAVAHLTRWRRQGDFAVAPDGPVALPRIERRRYLGQEWGDTFSKDDNLGLILRQRLGNDWRLQASSIRSTAEDPESTFHLFTAARPDGTANASVIRGRDRRAISWAHEAKLERDWRSDDALTVLDLGLRSRRSDFRNPALERLEVGRIRFADGIPQLDEPGPLTPSDAGEDRVRQREAGFSLRHERRSGWAFGLGLRRSQLEQRNRAAGEEETEGEESTWLYNASVVVPLGAEWTAFAATTRGIEESGAAPLNATNRFEVLPAALSRQLELGAKWQVTENLSLITTAFELERPNTGFLPDGRFDYIGEVRHRGLEASLAGRIGETWSVVLGALSMQPRISGPDVDAGRLGERPVGRSARIAVASLNHQPVGSPWSFDATLNYNGPRPADALNRIETAGFTSLALGTRYRFKLGDAPSLLRLRIGNVTDKDAWFAGSSGLQAYTAPRRFDLLLTVGD
jgi:iron complex outermembrane receptor protein